MTASCPYHQPNIMIWCQCLRITIYLNSILSFTQHSKDIEDRVQKVLYKRTRYELPEVEHRARPTYQDTRHVKIRDHVSTSTMTVAGETCWGRSWRWNKTYYQCWCGTSADGIFITVNAAPRQLCHGTRLGNHTVDINTQVSTRQKGAGTIPGRTGVAVMTGGQSHVNHDIMTVVTVAGLIASTLWSSGTIREMCI